MFNIIQDEMMDELFCISKTTVQIDCPNQGLVPKRCPSEIGA